MRFGWCQGFQFVAGFLLAISLAACDGSDNTYVPPPPAKVQVALPLQRAVTEYFYLTGNTDAVKSVDIEARVQGFIESIDYKDGAAVKAGDQLFGIQRDIYKAQVDQAQAELASQQASQVGAQQEYDRQLNLLKQQVTTQTAVDSARATLDEANASILNAQASLELANINLGYTKVVAPFDGTMTNHLVDVGALVGVSGPTTLATIVQIDPLYVYFNVSEPQVLSIKRSLTEAGHTMTQVDLPTVPVEIGLRDEQGYPHRGHLDYVSPQLDSSTGTLTVRGIVENKDRQLLPGLFVRVRVPVARQDKALLVRDDAIGQNQLGSYVLVLGKDDVIEQRVVTIGQRDGQMRVIEKGLGPEDWVVMSGVQRAIPGNKVSPERVEMDGAGADASASAGETPKSGTP
ncbi:efflux RND transporter periplasmic adaptor subunit [Rhizobiaceae bacterium n13]|uniref:Efflux RND transporter periplasmic adaptor subunit n=1 Tax=Ferirhizobium litorale TaxID=2927786 RepID=A0AAE3QI32_9HYPH|nr:efflux RND transporter periplasmic adaptor subunit [Fererhizobium litorale]MDI7862776.1 efflux RND transporter periplasmic adaptor subunit [Fererhizobium litorale]MDI7924360.1 efflux RND transporter periplasmic adaptor subunit [Fererhizobium litorale]